MLYEVTPEEFNEKLQEKIKYLTVNKTKLELPCAYLIVGQPGSGKTVISYMINEKYKGDIIFINGDEYRKAHPHYKALYKKYGDDAVLKTQDFAGKMTESLIDKLSDLKYNLMIEGTLRSLEVPLKTQDLLKGKGYQVELTVMLTRPEISYLSTLKRYHEMKEAGTSPRMTPKEHHDLVVKNIIENLNVLYKQRVFSRISMYDRTQKEIYSSKKNPLVNPSVIMKKAFNRSLTKEELQKIKKEYGPYASTSILKKILSENLER